MFQKSMLFGILMVSFSPLLSQTLESSLSEMLESHPAIQTLERSARSQIQGAKHESVYPDPKFTFAFQNFAYRPNLSPNLSRSDNPSMTGLNYGISQEIPFPGKLNLQEEIATLKARSYTHYVSQVKNVFLKEYLISLTKTELYKKQIEILESKAKVIRSLQNIAKANYVSGSAGSEKFLDQKIGLIETQDKILSLDGKKEESLANAKYYFFANDSNAEFPSFILLSQFFLKKENLLQGEIQDYTEEVLARSPDLKQVEAELQTAKRKKKYANILHNPDTEVFFSYLNRASKPFLKTYDGVNYMMTSPNQYGGDLFSFGVTMRVPVWSWWKEDNLQSEAKEEIRANQSATEDARLKLDSKVRRLFAQWKAAVDRSTLYQKELIPQLEQTLRVISSNYSTGKTDLTKVLNYRLKLLDAQYTEQELLLERYSSLSEMLQIGDLFLNGTSSRGEIQ